MTELLRPGFCRKPHVRPLFSSVSLIYLTCVQQKSCLAAQLEVAKGYCKGIVNVETIGKDALYSGSAGCEWSLSQAPEVKLDLRTAPRYGARA